MSSKRMTIQQQVIEQLYQIKKQGTPPKGLAVVLGAEQEAQMANEATSQFFVDQVRGKENLCGLPIVRVASQSYFAVEVPTKS
ncbi:hypothetical protein V2K58_08470 [Pseudomonas alliivorans]|nr:hypothetical protein [Pseudomonas alliivorans]